MFNYRFINQKASQIGEYLSTLRLSKLEQALLRFKKLRQLNYLNTNIIF